MYRHEGRQQAVLRHHKAGGVGLVDVDGIKVEAPQIELVAHLQRHHQVLLHIGGVLVVFDLLDLLLYRVQTGAAVLGVKRLGPDGEESGVERQRPMHLEPCDTERHHHVGHGVGLGEQIADLGQGFDVPVRHLMVPHGLLPSLLKAALLHLAFTDGLHDLEGHLGVQPHGDEVQHNVVAAAHRLQNGGGAADDQFPGVAQPHVGTVGEAGQTHQRVEIPGLGVHQHAAGEAGVELGDGHGAGGAEDLVILEAQHPGGREDAHGIGVVQRDSPCVDAGKILQHPDHGGIIVSQHVQLQQVILHAVVFKMGGDGIALRIVGGVLHSGEILHVHVVRHHHQAARMLAGGAPHAHAALSQPVHLGVGGRLSPLLQILFHHAEGGLFRQRTDGTGAEHLGLSEHLDSVLVSAGLIFAGEVQVDIRHLAAAVAQERLKGDIKAVLDVLFPAHRADLVRHVRAAAVAAVCDELRIFALGAAVVGRQGVHLRDARHVRHQTGAHGASRAHQIAVLQTALHQLLGGHIHHVVLAQDAFQFHVQTVHDELRRLLPVQLMALVPHHVVQLLLGVFQARREQLPRRQQLDILDAVGNVPRVVDDYLVGRLCPQVRELLQHLVCCLEVDGQRCIGVGELLAGQQDVAVHLILRLLKMHVAGGAHRLAQLLPQPDDGAVEIPQLLLRLDIPLAKHEHVVADGLDLQIVVERRDALQLRPVLAAVSHGAEQLARLAGRADDEPLPMGRQLRLGNDGHALEIFQIGRRDQLVQVLQAQLVLGQNDDVLGMAVALSALRPQLQHLPVDLLEPVDAHLPAHFLKKRDEHIPHHGRVIGGTVVVEGGQVQMLRYDVQLVLVQLRQQVLRQDKGVYVGRVELQPHLPAPLADEADVELRVVGRQRSPVHEL